MFLKTDHIPAAKPNNAPAAVPKGFSRAKCSSICLPPIAPNPIAAASVVPKPAKRITILVVLGREFAFVVLGLRFGSNRFFLV